MKIECVLDLVSFDKLENGDFFIWESMSGRCEIHMYHSDSGYGIKTWTDYNKKDGSSMTVNYSGIRGKIVVK
jgi:hypothetical protein